MMTTEPNEHGDAVLDLRPSAAMLGQLAEVHRRCDDLAGRVASLAEEADGLWRDALHDGELAFRLVEASQSLHRASLALREDLLLGLDGS